MHAGGAYWDPESKARSPTRASRRRVGYCPRTSRRPLIEREEELARIDAALDAAIAGRGATVLIEADAGVGKTSLLVEARAR